MPGVQGLGMCEEAEKYAARQGLFVIRATGSSASIINQAGFRPKRFDPGANASR